MRFDTLSSSLIFGGVVVASKRDFELAGVVGRCVGTLESLTLGADVPTPPTGEDVPKSKLKVCGELEVSDPKSPPPAACVPKSNGLLVVNAFDLELNGSLSAPPPAAGAFVSKSNASLVVPNGSALAKGSISARVGMLFAEEVSKLNVSFARSFAPKSKGSSFVAAEEFSAKPPKELPVPPNVLSFDDVPKSKPFADVPKLFVKFWLAWIAFQRACSKDKFLSLPVDMADDCNVSL